VFFWLLQLGLGILWLSLDLAGIKKGLWQLQQHQSTYGDMMLSLKPYFIAIGLGGTLISIAFTGLIVKLLQNHFSHKHSPPLKQ
jgi:cbb3-type cytochrome oxidase subunit 1